VTNNASISSPVSCTNEKKISLVLNASKILALIDALWMLGCKVISVSRVMSHQSHYHILSVTLILDAGM
jgi:hypothetical protein